MTHLANIMTNRISFVVLSAVLAVWLLLMPSIGQSEPISDLESEARDYTSHAQHLYTLDKENMIKIWEVYCGEVDPNHEKDTQYAAEFGRKVQSEEQEQFDQLIAGEFPPLMEAAKELLKDKETKDRAQTVLDALKKEDEKLRKLSDGLVLKGSNHPFTRFAIEYGKKQHKELCEKRKVNGIMVCDKEFSGADGRPDLVTVKDDVLTVYEFKPKTRKAMDKGEEQLKRYRDPVQSYYQKYFPDGRDGGFKGVPPNEYGGQDILETLKKSEKAWSSDGKELKVVPLLDTYDVCDKKFD